MPSALMVIVKLKACLEQFKHRYAHRPVMYNLTVYCWCTEQSELHPKAWQIPCSQEQCNSMVRRLPRCLILPKGSSCSKIDSKCRSYRSKTSQKLLKPAELLLASLSTKRELPGLQRMLLPGQLWLFRGLYASRC